MIKPFHIQSFGHQSNLIQWPENAPRAINHLTQWLLENFAHQMLDLVPAYRELAIYWHESVDVDEKNKKINAHLAQNLNTEDAHLKVKKYIIPVCYDLDKGWDLETMAAENDISTGEIVGWHTKASYTIHFLGFLPGFPYLSGLDAHIHHPRKQQPRSEIAAGAVGIAGDQTGIYPCASPGGWNIIGQTPIQLFDIQSNPPALLQPGHQLQFESISSAEFKKIQNAVEKGNYTIKEEYD